MVALPAAAAALAAAVATPAGSRYRPEWRLAVLILAVALAGPPVITLRSHWLARRLARPGQATTRRVLAARRWVADIGLVCVAAGSLIVLRQLGPPPSGGVNVYASAAPALAAIPAAIIAMRAYPFVLRWLLRLTRRRRGVTVFVGLARGERTALSSALPVFALVLALAIVAFGATLRTAVQRADVLASWQDTGADAVLTAQPGSVLSPALQHAVAAVPGVQRAATAVVATGSAGDTYSIPMVIVDPARYGALVAGTPAPPFPGAALARPPAGHSVPVLVSAAARSLLDQFGGALGVAGRALHARVAGVVPTIALVPGGGPFIVVPSWSLPPAEPNAMVVIGSGLDNSALAALAAVVRRGPTPAPGAAAAVGSAGRPRQRAAAAQRVLHLPGRPRLHGRLQPAEPAAGPGTRCTVARPHPGQARDDGHVRPPGPAARRRGVGAGHRRGRGRGHRLRTGPDPAARPRDQPVGVHRPGSQRPVPGEPARAGRQRGRARRAGGGDDHHPGGPGQPPRRGAGAAGRRMTAPERGADMTSDAAGMANFATPGGVRRPHPASASCTRRPPRDRDSYGQGSVISCDRLVRIFRTEGVEVQALQGLDLLVERGELAAMVGASGSGKSTLLNILAGLDTPTAGRVHVAGHDLAAMSARERLAYRRSTVGFIWQQTSRNLLPYLTARQNVMLPMQLAGVGRGPAFAPGRGPARRARHRALRGSDAGPDVGRRAAARRDRHRAGEPARGAARGRADRRAGQRDGRDVFAALQTANAELGATVLIVTHDPAVSAEVRRTIAIRNGRTSSETLRHSVTDEHGNAAVSSVEYAVLDRAGRVQLPAEMLESLGMRDRVVLRAEPDHIGVWPDPQAQAPGAGGQRPWLSRLPSRRPGPRRRGPPGTWSWCAM